MKSFIRNFALFICICSLGLASQVEAKSKHKDKEQCERDCLSKCDKREKRYQKKLEKKEKRHAEKAEKKERKRVKEEQPIVISPSDKPIIIETPKVEIKEAVIDVGTDQPVVVGERKN